MVSLILAAHQYPCGWFRWLPSWPIRWAAELQIVLSTHSSSSRESFAIRPAVISIEFMFRVFVQLPPAQPCWSCSVHHQLRLASQLVVSAFCWPRLIADRPTPLLIPTSADLTVSVLLGCPWNLPFGCRSSHSFPERCWNLLGNYHSLPPSVCVVAGKVDLLRQSSFYPIPAVLLWAVHLQVPARQQTEEDQAI